MQVAVDDRMDLEIQLLPSLLADNSGGSSPRKSMRRTILLVRSSLIFIARGNHGEAEARHRSPPVSRISSSKSIDNGPEDDETVRIDMMEEAGGEVVDEAQTAPLLKPVDNNLSSRQRMRKLTLVLYSSLVFKAGVHVPAAESSASSAGAFVHLGSSDATERVRSSPPIHYAQAMKIIFQKAEVAEASDTSVTINQLQRSQSQNISKIVREKKFSTLEEFGGLGGVAHALNTDLDTGLSDSEAEAIHRSKQKEFSLSPTFARRFSHLVFEALNNNTILLLSLAAALSLGFGIAEEGLENGWFDGVIILITIIVLVFFNLIRKYWEERRARKKLEKQHFTKRGVGEVHVIRGGEAKCICKSKLVCGDIVLLKKGYQVPADGLFVTGQALELDYGSKSYIIDRQNPFLSYGERVIDGDARMVVTSMDMNTGWWEMMSKASSDPDTKFPLEAHLDKLNTCIYNTGLVINILILIVLFTCYRVGKMDEDNGYRPESRPEPVAMRSFANSFKKIIRESKYTTRALTKLLSVSLVGVTEGVAFVVSLTILYRNHETLSGKATEQDSQVVAKMASVTRICSDTFGDFTEDEMEVDKLFVGKEVISGCTTISPVVIEALCDGIGTLMEKPFLHWAKDKLGFKKERVIQSWKVFDRIGKNPFEEPCDVLMRGIGESDGMFLHSNGPVKDILRKCKYYYDSKGCVADMDVEVTRFLDEANEDMLHKQLRTIAFACKRTDTQTLDADDLVLVALLGLQSRSREVTRTTVEACRECGIETVIVSSKKESVLRNIAPQWGLTTNGDSEPLVLTGEVFRKYTDEERFEKVDKIRFMGEALPSDKFLLVKSLRQKGEVVAFLGQRTDEAPALRGADIGIAMGTWSSEKARGSSEIIIWDGSFVDLISIVSSGKCIYDNIQKYLQLVLIMTISSTLINFSGTVALGDAPLTAVQLAWVNLAVAFLGGLALLTKLSADEPVSLVPVSCRRSLINADMTRNILAQVLYQAICLLILQVKGSGVVGTSQDIKSMVSNSFILCQFFNQFNARELQKKNFFRGIHRHQVFWVAVAAFIVLQAAFVMIQDMLYGTRLDWKQWAGCVLVGAASWLVDWLAKCTSQFIEIIVMKLRDTSW